MAAIRTKDAAHEGKILGRQSDALYLSTKTGTQKIPPHDIVEIEHPGTSRLIWGSGLVVAGILMIFAGRDGNCRDSCTQPLGPLDTLGYVSTGLGGILAISGGVSWYGSRSAETKTLSDSDLSLLKGEMRYAMGLAYRF